MVVHNTVIYLIEQLKMSQRLKLIFIGLDKQVKNRIGGEKKN